MKTSKTLASRDLGASTHPQSRDIGAKAWVRSQDLIKDRGAIRLTQRLVKRPRQGDVHPAILINLVDHLDGVGQAHGVHADLLELRDDVGDALVLQALWDHDVRGAGPVGAGEGDDVPGGVEDVAARGGEGRVWP